ncbi:hypothetical protein [Staphylococcus phage PMBT8]|nr:hypothetical protein [Staphylococcus phage PMBT8]
MHKKGYEVSLMPYEFKELENKLNEYKDIYKVIDSYESKAIQNKLEQEQEMLEVEKLFRGE